MTSVIKRVDQNCQKLRDKTYGMLFLLEELYQKVKKKEKQIGVVVIVGVIEYILVL